MGTGQPWRIDEQDAYGRTRFVLVEGDASLAARELRSTLAAATAAGELSLVVDVTHATGIGGPVAWELCRAHERLLWRGGQLLAVGDPAVLRPLLEAFGLHRSPDVLATRDEALRALGSEGEAEPEPAAERRAPPLFAWRRQDRPTAWSFQLRGGRDAPRVARAAVRRLLDGRLSEEDRNSAVLAVSEMVSNSVVHGGAGPNESLDIDVLLTDASVRVEVTDPVGGFEPPPYPDDPLRIHGRGLPLIHSLAQSWGIDTPPDGRVWFELARPGAGSPPATRVPTPRSTMLRGVGRPSRA